VAHLRALRFVGRLSTLFLAPLLCLGSPAPALADQLAVEPRDDEAGYRAIDELSYEVIVEPSDGFSATVRYRVALANTSSTPRDAVLSLALPFAARVEGLAIARDGQWTAGVPTGIAETTERRDPGAVFVRGIPAATRHDIPGAEIVVFGLDPGTPLQVELKVRVYPRLLGDRWELDLPARGATDDALSGERRVLVTGLPRGESFFVDARGNEGSPFIVSPPTNMVTVAWPAHLKGRSPLEGHLETIPGPPGFDDGDLRLFLRLGQTPAPVPDHVVLLFDHSLSTPERLPSDALRATAGLFGALSEGASFDALAFDRHVTPLVEGAPLRDQDALPRLASALEQRKRGQGTDLAAALLEAAARTRARKGGKSMIVVFTDGMFPEHDIDRLQAAFSEAAGTHRPEVLFVIEEPMFASVGLATDHPVARLAAQLGARISLKTLGQLDESASGELLHAPRVLGELSIDLPKGAQLFDPLPPGLVAGSFVLLRGQYVGSPPRHLQVQGRFGTTQVRKRVAAQSLPRPPVALVAQTRGDLALTATEGFSLPPWYRSQQGQDAQRGITQAGRAGDDRRGYLTAKIFRHYLTTRVLPRARACYNRGLLRHRDQEGRIVLAIEAAKGEVMLARVSESGLKHPDPALVSCLTEAAWALDIPAGKLDARIYRLNYPLRLVAPEPGKTEGRVERLNEDVTAR